VIAEDDFFTRYPNAKGNSKTQSGSVELDEYDGRLHYDVKFYVKGYEADYEIDAYTGEILTWEVEHEGTVDREKKTNTAGNSQGAVSISAGNSADIGSDAAKAVALSHAGLTEAQVTDLRVEKDRDDGRVEYEVEFRAKGMEYEYTIDAATGAVLEHEKDRDD